MTNAERIRAMDDEELAEKLRGQCTCCAYQITDCFGIQCVDGVIEWLRKEADEDAGTD